MKKIKQIILLLLALVMVSTVTTAHKVEAASGYTIQVNKGTNVVTVFDASGNVVKAMTCSTGSATPVGTFKTKTKYRWWELDGPSYGQYCTRITGHILFHSVWYYRKDSATQSTKEFNKLGTTASHGCVRLATADSKWIYDNCSLSTTVNIINGSAANDPWGKPEMIKVNTDNKMDWDPTDPDILNPYNYKGASIDTSKVKKTVSYGKTFHPKDGLKAYDTCGNDITSKVSVSGKVKKKKLGKYNVVYTVTDALGRSASKIITVRVKDTYKAKITGVSSKKTVEYKKSLNLKSKVKAKTVSGKNITKKLKIYVKSPGSSKYKICKSGKYQFKKTGTFKVKYYVKNTYNKKVTTKYMKVLVRDTKAPILTGVSKNKTTIAAGESVNLLSGVKAKLVSGKNITSRLKVTVYNQTTGTTDTIKSVNKQAKMGGVYQFSMPATYVVTYTVKNPTGKKETTLSKTYVVKDLAEPVISGVNTVSKTAYQNDSISLFDGVNANLKTGASVTASLQATVTYTGDGSTQTFGYSTSTTYTFSKVGTYVITYTAYNPNNKASSSVSVTYVVVDGAAPVISGVNTTTQSVTTGTSLSLFSNISAALVSGTDVSSTLTVSIVYTAEDGTTSTLGSYAYATNQGATYTFANAGTYVLTYMATNTNNNTTTNVTATYGVSTTVSP
ncbi:MAG: L,D-transpeptidase [Lachnospiraceae bacterium]|nr:L,D-transpeptidase [Lachnospiraceae bacterium]